MEEKGTKTIENQKLQDQQPSPDITPDLQLADTQIQPDTIADQVENLQTLPSKINRYLVALDGSEECEWAFNSTLNRIDKDRDLLFLLTITSKRILEEQSSRILLKFAQKAERFRASTLKVKSHDIALYCNDK